jgi:FkbM family methyltransferase
MNNFGLVVIGAHHGFWLQDEIKNNCKNILLIEPVPYNFLQLKERYGNFSNIFFEQNFIGDTNSQISFFFVKEDSIAKLGKHWASGIGSFSKKHILNHKSKRFNIKDNDINEIQIQSITFNELCKKHNITIIDKLLIDVEGAEKKIIESIDYKKILIKELIFEYKHLDGNFTFDNNLKKIIKFLNDKGFKETSRDKENITFNKIV